MSRTSHNRHNMTGSSTYIIRLCDRWLWSLEEKNSDDDIYNHHITNTCHNFEDNIYWHFTSSLIKYNYQSFLFHRDIFYCMSPCWILCCLHEISSSDQRRESCCQTKQFFTCVPSRMGNIKLIRSVCVCVYGVSVCLCCCVCVNVYVSVYVCVNVCK